MKPTAAAAAATTTLLLGACASWDVTIVRTTDQPVPARAEDAPVALTGGPFALIAKKLEEGAANACGVKVDASPVIRKAADEIDWDEERMSAPPLRHVASVVIATDHANDTNVYESMKATIERIARQVGANLAAVHKMQTKTAKRTSSAVQFEAYDVDCVAAAAGASTSTSTAGARAD